MGQATVDLPDPLDRTAPPGPASRDAAGGSVDDMLAQMAGEEIDRLLSEADEPPPPTSSREPAPLPSIDTAPPPAASPKTHAAPAADDALAAQLDDLYKQLDGGAAQPEPFKATEQPAAITSKDKFVATEPAAAVHVTSPKPAAPPQPHSAAEEVAQALAEEELQALSLNLTKDLLNAPAADVPAPAAAAEPQDAQDDAPLPFYLKPLEWMSMPLESLPERIRQLLGKLALMTLFNATAVLIYVFVFRKHK